MLRQLICCHEFFIDRTVFNRAFQLLVKFAIRLRMLDKFGPRVQFGLAFVVFELESFHHALKNLSYRRCFEFLLGLTLFVETGRLGGNLSVSSFSWCSCSYSFLLFFLGIFSAPLTVQPFTRCALMHFSRWKLLALQTWEVLLNLKLI